jgi:hypothetical protein
MRTIDFEGDVARGVAAGLNWGVPCPPALLEVPLERLRLLGGEVVDAAALGMREWHIDAAGVRHVTAAADRQPLTCAWEAPLVRAEGVWSVRSADDIRHEALLAYAAAVRFDVETSGTTVNDMAVATDRQSQAMMASALAYLQQQAGTASVRWKTPSGVFVDLDLTGLTAVAMSVAAHVQRCFAREAEVVAAIAAGDITTAAEIDAAFAAL